MQHTEVEEGSNTTPRPIRAPSSYAKLALVIRAGKRIQRASRSQNSGHGRPRRPQGHSLRRFLSSGADKWQNCCPRACFVSPPRRRRRATPPLLLRTSLDPSTPSSWTTGPRPACRRRETRRSRTPRPSPLAAFVRIEVDVDAVAHELSGNNDLKVRRPRPGRRPVPFVSQILIKSPPVHPVVVRLDPRAAVAGPAPLQRAGCVETGPLHRSVRREGQVPLRGGADLDGARSRDVDFAQ